MQRPTRVATIALTSLAVCLVAATPPATPNPVLKPGNELLLVIPDPKPTQHVVVIDPDGRLALSNYATIEAGGLTLDEARARAREALGAFIVRTAAISLVLTDDRHYVNIEGHVGKPGPVRVSPAANIWQAIHEAGGPAQGADVGRVELVRDGQVRMVDIQAYLERSTNELPTLQAGDKVVVPKSLDPGGRVAPRTDLAHLRDKVFVFGAVRNPGLYHRSEGMTVLTAVGLAGGPGEDADLASVRVMTPTDTRRVNLADVMLGKAVETASIPEGGGVLVFVPEVRPGQHEALVQYVNVIGGVNQPGRHTISGSISLLDAFSLAGGPKPEGDIEEVYVLTVGPGFTLSAEYDLEELLEEGSVAAMVTLHSGDTVFVGQNAFQGWQTVVQVISNLAIISAAIVVFVGL